MSVMFSVQLTEPLLGDVVTLVVGDALGPCRTGDLLVLDVHVT